MDVPIKLYDDLSNMGHYIDRVLTSSKQLRCGVCGLMWRAEDDPALTVCQKNPEYLQKLVNVRQSLHERGFRADDWPDEAVAEIERLERFYRYWSVPVE